MQRVLLEIDDLILDAYKKVADHRGVARNALMRSGLYLALFGEIRNGLRIPPAPTCPRYLDSFAGIQRHGRARELNGKLVPVDEYGLVIELTPEDLPKIGDPAD